MCFFMIIYHLIIQSDAFVNIPGGVRTVGEEAEGCKMVVLSGSTRIFFILCVNAEPPLVDASLRCLFFLDKRPMVGRQQAVEYNA